VKSELRKGWSVKREVEGQCKDKGVKVKNEGKCEEWSMVSVKCECEAKSEVWR